MSESAADGERPGAVSLRAVADADVAIFFEQQLDPTANHMAAFTSADPHDRAAFFAHFERILADERISVQTVVHRERVAGYLACFERFGKREVSYWLGKEHWGQGVATRALSLFLTVIAHRPLYARAASDNQASLRVLEKCGFAVAGHDRFFANARGAEIAETILVHE